MHYDESYFQWQKETVGEFGGQSEQFKFRQFVKPEDTVLDFGCGGGYVLSNLNCRRRLGVDVNPSAREQAKTNGLEVFESVEQLPDQVIDVVISNHALEHVPSPFDVLSALRRKLKSTSVVVFVVPHECTHKTWKPNDINMHLYTWNSMTLGNLFVSAGYAIERVDAIRHCQIFCYRQLLGLVGHEWCHRLGYLEARLRGISQVRVVARPGNLVNPIKVE
jgi:SAM-dependent methyltransferase